MQHIGGHAAAVVPHWLEACLAAGHFGEGGDASREPAVSGAHAVDSRELGIAVAEAAYHDRHQALLNLGLAARPVHASWAVRGRGGQQLLGHPDSLHFEAIVEGARMERLDVVLQRRALWLVVLVVHLEPLKGPSVGQGFCGECTLRLAHFGRHEAGVHGVVGEVGVEHLLDAMRVAALHFVERRRDLLREDHGAWLVETAHSLGRLPSLLSHVVVVVVVGGVDRVAVAAGTAVVVGVVGVVGVVDAIMDFLCHTVRELAHRVAQPRSPQRSAGVLNAMRVDLAARLRELVAVDVVRYIRNFAQNHLVPLLRPLSKVVGGDGRVVARGTAKLRVVVEHSVLGVGVASDSCRVVGEDTSQVGPVVLSARASVERDREGRLGAAVGALLHGQKQTQRLDLGCDALEVLVGPPHLRSPCCGTTTTTTIIIITVIITIPITIIITTILTIITTTAIITIIIKTIIIKTEFKNI